MFVFTPSVYLLVNFKYPAPDVGRVSVLHVLHREDLTVLLRTGVLRPERRKGLKKQIKKKFSYAI